MCDALGIINFEDSKVDIQGLQSYRPAAAVNFLGRYRLIDFVLSNMSNSGISNVQVYVKEKPRGIIEQLGDGSTYNINSKRGSLNIMYGEEKIMFDFYNTDIANFMQNMQYIEENAEPYVVVAPSYMIYQADYETVLHEHIKSGADITIMYKHTDDAKDNFLACDALVFEKGDKKVEAIEENKGNKKTRDISLEAYVLSKKLFIELVQRAANTSSLYWFKDILKDVVGELNVQGYPVKGYVACINSLASYLKANMELKNHEMAESVLRPEWPIYTLSCDSAPTLFAPGAKVKGCAIANGCTIEGTVENCVIGRNVTIKKGAVVQNSVILPGAYISDGAKLDHCVVDKYAIVHHIKKLEGTDEEPIYVKRRDRI